VLRPGTKGARQVTLEAENFRPETVLGVVRRADNTWEYLADRENRIAHVRIAALNHGTAEDFLQVLTALQAEGLRGLILDLRWCPGGFLDQAVEVARLLLGQGIIAIFQSREDRKTARGGRDQFTGFPVVVLVNGETSGGAELVAAALQDNRRAVVAGQRTLGKASVQTLVALPVSDAYLKLTTGTFFRPSGKNLHRFPESRPTEDWGVRPEPELEFRVSPELGRHLRESWLLQTLRPGASNEALPLDDPEGDPQRQATLQELLGIIK
jgi:carboxyl-terminal processing protease